MNHKVGANLLSLGIKDVPERTNPTRGFPRVKNIICYKNQHAYREESQDFGEFSRVSQELTIADFKLMSC